MNERIRELAEQAGFYFDEYNEATQRKVELLAELIVKDCMTKIALIGVSNFENDDIMWTIELATEMIKERFGVKE